MLILLVDDDKLVGKATKRLLTREGHEVVSAESYSEAVQLGQQPQIQLIITDYHLDNGKTGQDVVEAIGDGRPYLVMSGAMHLVPEEFQVFAEAALEKPYRPSELREVTNALSLQA